VSPRAQLVFCTVTVQNNNKVRLRSQAAAVAITCSCVLDAVRRSSTHVPTVHVIQHVAQSSAAG